MGSTIGMLFCAALAVSLAVGVAFHVMVPGRLDQAIDALGLPRGTARVVSGVEAGNAVILVTAPQFGALLAVLYLVSILSTFAWSRLQGRRVEDCGCFARPHAADGSFFLRNTILLALGLVAMQVAPRGDLRVALIVGVPVGIVMASLSSVVAGAKTPVEPGRGAL